MENKLRYLIDCDGVVADFSRHVIECTGSSLTPADITEWNIFKLVGEADGGGKMRHAYDLMEDTEFWRSLPLLEGAEEGIRKIKEAGHDVYWVTSPWPTCSGWDVARREWLCSNFEWATNDHVIITSAKYVCLGDVFIDDHIKNVEKWKQWHPTKSGLLMKAPYNQNHEGLEFFSWG